MKIAGFEWDLDNIYHIKRHHVETQEAEEVLEATPYLRKTSYGRYQACGPTLTGRMLSLVFLKKPGHKIRVITARNMTKKELKLYKKKRR